MRHRILPAIVITATIAAWASPGFSNGLGESKPFQFRSENQRQVLLGAERTRLEYLGLIGGSGSGLGGGSGQNGNVTSITVGGSGNTINVDQTNSGAQTQTTDCTNSQFNVTGGMYGC